MIALHPEDLKAAIRKRYGTVRAFERFHGIPINSVPDLLRGRQSAPVTKVIEAFLGTPFTLSTESNSLDCSAVAARKHRLNRKAA